MIFVERRGMLWRIRTPLHPAAACGVIFGIGAGLGFLAGWLV